MAYTKQTWENAPSTNSPLSADRLNHMEDGIYNSYYQAKNTYSSTATDIYGCNYINGMNGTILWTNESPTSSFAEQTITLSDSLSNYNSYEIIYKQSTTTNRYFSTGRIPVGMPTGMYFTSNYIQYRVLSESNTMIGDTILIGAGKKVTALGSSSDDNTLLVPIYIIGYKTGIFS